MLVVHKAAALPLAVEVVDVDVDKYLLPTLVRRPRCDV